MPNQSADAPPKTKKGAASAQPSTSSDLPIDYWARHRPGDDVIPANAERVEWAGGLVLFQGTRHHPLISFETEREARRWTGQSLRLWRTELIQHECDSLDSFRVVGGLISPNPASLPRLPPLAAPSGWDYWGRPWAYLDAPSGHKEVGVNSTLSPPSTRVTVAVLVDCPHEPQFLPDIAVAQSASVAAGRAKCHLRQLLSGCSLVATVSAIASPSWNNSRRGRLSICSTLGDAKTLLCPKGMSHRHSVPKLSFMERHLKPFQGVLP